MISEELKALYQECRAELRKVSEPPWYVGDDNAKDCPSHRNSGLALVDTGRSEDWPIARLCEWAQAEFIAASPSRISLLCDEIEKLVAGILEYEHRLHDPRCIHSCFCKNKAQWLAETKRLLEEK